MVGNHFIGLFGGRFYQQMQQDEPLWSWALKSIGGNLLQTHYGGAALNATFQGYTSRTPTAAALQTMGGFTTGILPRWWSDEDMKKKDVQNTMLALGLISRLTPARFLAWVKQVK